MEASRSAPVPAVAIAAACLAACALFAIAMLELRAQTPAGAVLAVGIALLPILAIVAWRAPLIFPYGAYVVLIPFDLLLAVPAFGTAARACGALSGLALLVWLIRTRKIAMPGPALAAWGSFVLWAFLSMLWTLDPTNGLREIGTLAQMVSLYAIVSLTPTTLRSLRFIFGAVALGGLAAAVFGIYQLTHLSAMQQLINQVSDRIPLLLGNQSLDINEFADSLLLPIAVLTVAGARAKKLAFKVGALLAVCVLLYAVSLAASREAFIAVAVMLGYFAIALRERWQILGATVVLAALTSANANLLQRFLAASASGGSGRLSIWTAGFGAFRERWLFGAGSGSFAAAYDRVYLKIFQAYDMGWSRAAHNILLQNSVEYGAIGIVLLVAALICTFRSIPAVDRKDPAFGMRVSLIGGLLALCVAGLFVDLTTSKMLWLTFALAAQLRGQILGAHAAAAVQAHLENAASRPRLPGTS